MPDRVASLVAKATSKSQILLSFAAPADDSAFPHDEPPATRYVVRHSLAPINGAADFAAARSICDGGVCEFAPARVGSGLSLEVNGLKAGTTYYYAVAAVNDLGQGAFSAPASATTDAIPPAAPPPADTGSGDTAGTTADATRCAAATTPGPNQVAYPGGAYALVGLPGGTLIPSDSPLYSWLDLGAGGAYTAGNEPATAGHGYWAWFRCPSLLDLGEATPEVTMPLGAYHASMVGNPSTSEATVTGHDFAARWDPSLNDGAGGYSVSGYREAQPLAVGEGAWVFSYAKTEVRVGT